MGDLVFMDTETLGLHPKAPVWEFAAIRRSTSEYPVQMFIQHENAGWIEDFPDEFKADYLARYNADEALPPGVAAVEIARCLKGAHIVGAVPSFDTERLAKLLRRHCIEPEWHYQLIDVENVVVGHLAAIGHPLTPPWKSDELSRAVGVNPEDFARHTAMGDVLWAKAQWDAAMTPAEELWTRKRGDGDDQPES